jgi:hypothetical protein
MGEDGPAAQRVLAHGGPGPRTEGTPGAMEENRARPLNPGRGRGVLASTVLIHELIDSSVSSMCIPTVFLLEDIMVQT